MIKFNTWEKYLIEKISKIRVIEKNILFKLFFLRMCSGSLSVLVPTLCSLVCFSVYQNSIGLLTVGKVYSMITLFNNLLHPVRIFFLANDDNATAIASSERIDKLVRLESQPEIVDDPSLERGSVKITDASFSWTHEKYIEFLQEGPVIKP